MVHQKYLRVQALQRIAGTVLLPDQYILFSGPAFFTFFSAIAMALGEISNPIIR
jgi:hypothetical protein